MPNVADMMDRVSDKFMSNESLRNPLVDILRNRQNAIGQVTQVELDHLKAELLAKLNDSTLLEDAIMSLMAESKYPENIPEAEVIGTGDLEEVLEQGYLMQIEPASRLIYTEQNNQLLFWANGESICISAQFAPTLKKIADGQAVELNIELADDEVLENIAGLLNESILMLIPTEE